MIDYKMPPFDFFKYLYLVKYDDPMCHNKIDQCIQWAKFHYNTIKMYAITLSLHPSEIKMLNEFGYDKFEYLFRKLKRLGYVGLVVSEFTKKKIEHIHGIVYNPNHELTPIYGKRQNIKYYINDELFASNVFKYLNSSQGISAWGKYLGKCYLPPSIIDFINHYND